LENSEKVLNEWNRSTRAPLAEPILTTFGLRIGTAKLQPYLRFKQVKSSARRGLSLVPGMIQDRAYPGFPIVTV